MSPRRTWLTPTSLGAIGLLLFVTGASAERLQLRTLGVEQGLPSSNVSCIVPDTRGFVWVCTSEGLARYDGLTFRTYTTADGLPHNNVTSMVQDIDGTYWVGTVRGLAHFDPNPSGGPAHPGLFRPVPMPTSAPGGGRSVQQYVSETERRQVFALYQDHSGNVWCGTGDGLFVVRSMESGPELVPIDAGLASPAIVRALMMDRRGRLWIGTNSGLYRRDQDGRVESFGNQGFLESGVNHNIVTSLLEGRDGWIWVGTEFAGLRQMSSDAQPGPVAVYRTWADLTGVINDQAEQVIEDRDGTIWWVGMQGVRSLHKGRRDDWADASVRRYGPDSGVPSSVFGSIALIPGGELWIAGEGLGITVVSHSGLTTFLEADGLASRAIHAVTVANDGTVVATTESFRGDWRLNRLEGDRFHPVVIDVGHHDWGWGWGQQSFQDPQGRWWLPTGQAAYRSPPVRTLDALAGAPLFKFPSPFPAAPFLRAGTLISDFSDHPPELDAWAVFRLFPDSRGYVWAGTMNRVGGHETPNELVRWDPATDRFSPFPNDDPNFVPMAFAEDRAGNVWIGGYNGGLKFVRPGATGLVDRSALVGSAQVRALHVDRSDRLWVATDQSVVQITDGDSDRASRRIYGPTDGLASMDTWSLAEDDFGRIYVGHAGGVDIIGTDGTITGRLSPADGLAPGSVWCALRDRTGNIWFGTISGLSRYVPPPSLATHPLSLFLTAVRAGGQAVPISEVGQPSVDRFVVPADAPTVDVEFAALGLTSPQFVRYQYRLEGAASDWSPPSDRRFVHFPNLAPGGYRLDVRAVAPSGAAASATAVVPFDVLRPIWLRWWFLASMLALLTAMLYAWHRLRLEHAVAVERVRLSVARDLHDELGANLARLSILGEVASRDPSRVQAVLADVSSTARRLVSTLGEVVWYVDPHKDDLASVLRLVDAHARELFAATGTEWSCVVPDVAESVPMTSDCRRHLYLLLKEATANIVAHARARRATLVTSVGASSTTIEVRDDGQGVEAAAPSAPGRGNGLKNMRARAEALGATLTVESTSAGTMVRISLPRPRLL